MQIYSERKRSIEYEEKSIYRIMLRSNAAAGSGRLRRPGSGSRQRADAQRDRVTKMRLEYAELSFALDTLRRDKQRRDQEFAQLTRSLEQLRKEKTEREANLSQAETLLKEFHDGKLGRISLEAPPKG